jgi:hypothetical protein
MSDFISRLYDEKTELKERYEKIASFISSEDFNKIDENQKGLLRIQYRAMETYLAVLNERLNLIENN